MLSDITRAQASRINVHLARAGTSVIVSAMSRRRKRVLAASGAAVTLVCAAGFFGSAFCTVMGGFRLGSRSVEYGLAGGSVGVAWGAWRPDALHGFGVAGPMNLFFWSPLAFSASATTLRLPLWIPMFGVGFPTAFLIRALRRPELGRCPNCGYDRSGAVSPTCPECGAGKTDT